MARTRNTKQQMRERAEVLGQHELGMWTVYPQNG